MKLLDAKVSLQHESTGQSVDLPSFVRSTVDPLGLHSFHHTGVIR